MIESLLFLLVFLVWLIGAASFSCYFEDRGWRCPLYYVGGVFWVLLAPFVAMSMIQPRGDL